MLFGGSTVGVLFRGGNQPVSENIKSDLEAKEREIEQLKAEISEKLQSLSSENIKHETGLKEKGEELQELEEKQKELQKLTEDLSKKKGEIQDTKESLIQLKQIQSHYEKTKKQLEAKLQRKESEILKIEKDKSSLETFKDKIQGEKKKIGEEIQQINERIQKVQDLQKLEMIVEGLKKQEVLKTQIKEIQDRERKLLDLRKEAMKGLKDSVTGMLERLVRDLKSKGIVSNGQNSDFQVRLEEVINNWKSTKK